MDREKENCAQEQKRVALGRGHQDTEAIDGARQAAPPTLQPSGFSLQSHLQRPSPPGWNPNIHAIFYSPPPPQPSPGLAPRAHYVSIYVPLLLSKSNSEGLKTG